MSAMRIFAVGLRPEDRKLITSHIRRFEIVSCESADEFKAWMSATDDVQEDFNVVFAGAELNNVTPIELAQLIRMKVPKTPAIFVVHKSDSSLHKQLRKNGFDNVFALPAQRAQLTTSVAKLEYERTQNLIKDEWVPVDMCDIEPNKELEFGLALHLKLNEKMVVYASKGDRLDSDRLSRLHDQGVRHVLVPKRDPGSFQAYAARRLFDLTRPTIYANDNERRQELRHAVREILRGLFNKDRSSNLSEEIDINARSIVSEFIVRAAPPDWFLDLLNSGHFDAGAPNIRIKMNTCSTIAGLIAIGLELESVAPIVIAALFHNLGLVEMDQRIANADPKDLSGDDLRRWASYPEKSENILCQRLLFAPEIVRRAIREHLERWNGKGFPRGLQKDAICKEAQIIAIASVFSRAIQNGATSLAEAFAQVDRPGYFDPVLMQSLRQVLID